MNDPNNPENINAAARRNLEEAIKMQRGLGITNKKVVNLGNGNYAITQENQPVNYQSAVDFVNSVETQRQAPFKEERAKQEKARETMFKAITGADERIFGKTTNSGDEIEGAIANGQTSAQNELVRILSDAGVPPSHIQAVMSKYPVHVNEDSKTIDVLDENGSVTDTYSPLGFVKTIVEQYVNTGKRQ